MITTILKRILLLISIALILTNCSKDNLNLPDPNNLPIEEIEFPVNFNFSTIKVVEIKFTAPEFLEGSVFEIYRKFENQNILVSKGTFDFNNAYFNSVSVPVITDSLFVVSRTFGLEKYIELPIIGNKVTYDYGYHYNAPREEAMSAQTGLKSAFVDNFSYMGGYTANGYPSYLFKVNDHAWETLFSNLNQTLPEGVSVPLTKPAFFESGKQSNLVLKEKSNVYITFAGEGTDQTSSLGYFIYDGSKPVGTQHKIIFPNASYPGSGGSLHSGDQVLLGEFPANTVIGWFLVPNGWNKQQKLVKDVKGIYYSVPSFNPEGIDELNQHMILLKDIQNEVIVLGFEDLPRNSASCDNDFNDVVFYITLDRLEAADLSNVNNTISSVDTDGDGIIDSLDQYPLDPTMAFNNGGGASAAGSIAFEDLWPFKGDYDFNDLIIDYQFNPITDANNLIKVLEINLTVRHIGASFHNGFGIEFPISPSKVQSVTGTKYTKSYLNMNGNGTENGQNNAVIFPFDDAWGVSGRSLNISVTFVDAISPSLLGSYPYNPFLVVDGTRGREIHLPDKSPTNNANFSYFGTGADFSRPANSLYYRSELNLPWAINVSAVFEIPVEKTPLNYGYLKFIDWAKSAGNQYPDWYLDLPGYRDYNFLY